MKINKLSLPHPVLGREDDVEGEYSVNCDVRCGVDIITLTTVIKFSNASLEKMIENGDAAYCLDINCPKTLYRQTFLSSKNVIPIEINSDFLRDKVCVAFYVVALKEKNDFVPEGVNADYENRVFLIQPGDVLAYGGETSFLASKSWEELKGISPFLRVKRGDFERGPYNIDLVSSDEKVIITLSQEDYDKFRSMSEAGFDDIFLSSIVLPTLLYTLNQMLENKDVYIDKKWFDLLEFRISNDKELKNLEFVSENVPQIAQILLANPFGKTLAKLGSFIENSLIEC